MTLSISGELFETIPWRNSQIGQRVSRIKYEELPQSLPVNALREFPRTLAIENPFGLRVLEAPNHRLIITHDVNNVKRYVA